jgi:hypothetical protein
VISSQLLVSSPWILLLLIPVPDPDSIYIGAISRALTEYLQTHCSFAPATCGPAQFCAASLPRPIPFLFLVVSSSLLFPRKEALRSSPNTLVSPDHSHSCDLTPQGRSLSINRGKHPLFGLSHSPFWPLAEAPGSTISTSPLRKIRRRRVLPRPLRRKHIPSSKSSIPSPQCQSNPPRVPSGP